MKNKRIGRPSGRIKTAKIEIAIEPEIKDSFMELLHSNNMQASVVIREWIIDFLMKEKR